MFAVQYRIDSYVWCICPPLIVIDWPFPTEFWRMQLYFSHRKPSIPTSINTYELLPFLAFCCVADSYALFCASLFLFFPPRCASRSLASCVKILLFHSIFSRSNSLFAIVRACFGQTSAEQRTIKTMAANGNKKEKEDKRKVYIFSVGALLRWGIKDDSSSDRRHADRNRNWSIFCILAHRLIIDFRFRLPMPMRVAVKPKIGTMPKGRRKSLHANQSLISECAAHVNQTTTTTKWCASLGTSFD